MRAIQHKGSTMDDKGLSEFISFTGTLEAGENISPLTFQVRINPAGEVEFDLGAIPLTNDTVFIDHHMHGIGPNFSLFRLAGVSEDGIKFETNDFFLNSMSNRSVAGSSYMRPEGECSTAEFHRKLVEPCPKPQLVMRLKGFQNFGDLDATCRLGKVAMGGPSKITNPDTLSGYIEVQASEENLDISIWRAEADKLLDHIRHVMSFAAATELKGPIVEFRVGDILQLQAWSQTPQAGASMQTFHYLDQKPVFDVAVKSFFAPPFKVKNLFFAISWFAMQTSHNEVRLVNAMTALENLIASNLNDDESLILPTKEFSKHRKILRKVIQECVDRWSTEAPAEVHSIRDELGERLADLNRRSLLKKLWLLSERWSVPLHDIGEDRIRKAKRARDLIVHRGHYYVGEDSSQDALWNHVTIVREVVVRFLFSALGFKGRYFSYVGGYHDAVFPPPEAQLMLSREDCT